MRGQIVRTWAVRGLVLGLLAVTAGCAGPGRATAPEDQPARKRDGRYEKLFRKSAAPTLEYWSSKPLPRELLTHNLDAKAGPEDRAAVERMRAGWFRPTDAFEELPLGVPPPWDRNPSGNSTWDLNRHSLRWLKPLVEVWRSTGDPECLALAQRVIRDWRAHNERRPGATPMVWASHAPANRLRLLCWFWELYRTSDDLEERFARELLELISGHADFIAGGAEYRPRANHGLEQNLALVEAASVVPELANAPRWRDVARSRLRKYVAENFSREGFHLEQSPGYHWFVLRGLGSLAGFLRANGLPPVPGVDETARRAASVWPYLIKPNNEVVNIGDTHAVAAGSDRELWEHWWGAGNVPPPAGSTVRNPRPEPGEFVLSFAAGYAIFTAYARDAVRPEPDTYALFKCNAFEYAHYHRDALSFVLYGLGRDWLVDSGLYDYMETHPERTYMRSARAHNLVLVDEADFELGPVRLMDSGRTARHDFVKAQHQLPNAVHTRAFYFVPPRAVEIRDQLVARDARKHRFSQLLHVAPGLQVKIVSERCAHLVAPDGRTCVIEQSGTPGAWRVVTGQRRPYWQGWYSPGFQQIEAAPVLYYTNTERVRECHFLTRIRLTRTEPAPAESARRADSSGVAYVGDPRRGQDHAPARWPG